MYSSSTTSKNPRRTSRQSVSWWPEGNPVLPLRQRAQSCSRTRI
jgi:hypothetical protein